MELTGPEKAVLMLLSLDESAAAPIVASLDATELRKLREVAAMMRAVPTTSLHEVYAEFIGRTKDLIAVPHGGITHLRRLAAAALGESRDDETVDEHQSSIERIALASTESVASVLEQEHPQVAAAILSQLDSARAARIFQQLPSEVQVPIMLRLSTMVEIPAGLLETVANAFAGDLPPPEAEAAISVDGMARAAGLVRKLGKDQAAEILSHLDDTHDEIAAEIRQAMFTFEDLRRVDVRAMRTILAEISSEVLVLSLKTASESLKEHIFSCMSARAADFIRDDLAVLGTVRLSDVEGAQRQFLEAALRLEAGGTITLFEDTGDVV
jgi:flagellar motor switch protein FliG